MRETLGKEEDSGGSQGSLGFSSPWSSLSPEISLIWKVSETFPKFRKLFSRCLGEAVAWPDLHVCIHVRVSRLCVQLSVFVCVYCPCVSNPPAPVTGFLSSSVAPA